MELLLQAIEEKLANVDAERKKWVQYREEHLQAASNLRDFQKSYRKDILVPIGPKALIPGHLYHTNEVLVGMYRGMFVNCSTDKALLVCEHRLGEAAKRLDALDTEQQMYRDRLELPADDVFGNQQEIIEEFDEETEEEWRIQHRIRVREHKAAEADERKKLLTEKDIDMDAIFEQAELMEELEKELEQLNVNDDNDLLAHLQQNNRLPDGSRMFEAEVAAPKMQKEMSVDAENTDSKDDSEQMSDEGGSSDFLALSAVAATMSIEDKIKFFEYHLKKARDYFNANPKVTNDNMAGFTDMRVTEECLVNAIEELYETVYGEVTNNESDSEPDNMVVDQKNGTKVEKRKFHSRDEFDRIEQEYAAQHKSKSELLIYYKCQLRNVMKSIASTTIDMHSSEEKRDLYEFISDRINGLRIEIQRERQIKYEEDFVDDDDIELGSKKGRQFEMNSTFDFEDFKEEEYSGGKRRISFASQPHTVTFFEDDEPCVVSQENINSLADASFQFFNSPSSSSASSVCGDDDDTQLENHPMNSTNDCDINAPINRGDGAMNTADNCGNDSDNAPSQAKPTTLVLQFSHSSNFCTATVSTDEETINSPLDIYRQFGSNIEIPMQHLVSPPSESRDVQRPIVSPNLIQLSKSMAPQANDSREQGQKLEVPNIDAKPTKSILKKCSLVHNEKRAPVISNDNEELPEADDPNEFPAFTEVLGEIVERSNHNDSNATNQNVQADINANAHQPNKRMSLFKRSRML